MITPVVIPDRATHAIRSASEALEAAMGHGSPTFTYKSISDADKQVQTLNYLKERFGSEKLLEGRMLEIGSGLGMFVATCRKNGIDCYGVEPEIASYTGLSRARELIFKENGLSNSRVLVAVGEKLPFKDHSFTHVVSFNVLEHVRHTESLLEESIRVLKPGGSLYFRCPNCHSFYEGHFGILWLPLFAYSKTLAKLWVRFCGKNPNFIDELNFVTVPKLLSLVRKLPVKLVQISDPVPSWKTRVKIIYSKKSRASLPLQMIWFLSSFFGASHIIRKLNMQYGISLMLKKTEFI